MLRKLFQKGPEIPLLSTYPQETKATPWKDTCTSVFSAELFTTTVKEQMDKEAVV